MTDALMEEALRLEEGLRRLNESDPPDFDPPVFLANPRHMCAGHRLSKAGGKLVSAAMDLKERYVTGWDELGRPLSDPESAELAILYKEGRCQKCGLTARSSSGKVVLVAERPPVLGRVARG